MTFDRELDPGRVYLQTNTQTSLFVYKQTNRVYDHVLNINKHTKLDANAHDLDNKHKIIAVEKTKKQTLTFPISAV